MTKYSNLTFKNSIRNSIFDIRHHYRGRAFTLIELLVVISIIGILMTLIIVIMGPIQRKGRDAKRKADVNLFLSGADLFKQDFKIYPNPTFYIGKYGGSTQESTALGALNTSPNNNLELDTDVPGCNSLPANTGRTNDFLNLNGQTIGLTAPNRPTQTELNTLPLLINPGFAAMNNFLICMKYIDRLVTDPNQTLSAGYNYRVSYDYVDIAVGAKLENTADKDLSTIYGVVADTRYFVGSGRSSVRQLADDSDVRANFYANSSASFTSSDGNYLYQCLINNAGTAIKRDDRSGNSHAPLASNTSGTWVSNIPANINTGDCRDTDSTDIDVRQSW